MICPTCASTLPADAHFCSMCGNSLAAPVVPIYAAAPISVGASVAVGAVAPSSGVAPPSGASDVMVVEPPNIAPVVPVPRPSGSDRRLAVIVGGLVLVFAATVGFAEFSIHKDDPHGAAASTSASTAVPAVNGSADNNGPSPATPVSVLRPLQQAGLVGRLTTQTGAGFRRSNDSVPLLPGVSSSGVYNFAHLTAVAYGDDGEVIADGWASPEAAQSYVDFGFAHSTSDSVGTTGPFVCGGDVTVSVDAAGRGARRASQILEDNGCELSQ
jgi:hypothetical protein